MSLFRTRHVNHAIDMNLKLKPKFNIKTIPNTIDRNPVTQAVYYAVPL